MHRLASILALASILGFPQPQMAVERALASDVDRQSRSTPIAQGTPTSSFMAIVSQSAGTFSFPYPVAKRFEWCPGGMQFGFEVNARTRTDEYDFGFSLFTSTGAGSCEQGNLQGLLSSGQTGAFQIQGGTGNMIPNSDRSISIRPDPQRRLLIVSVTGSTIVRHLFGSRPETVEFRITSPRGVEKRRVRVQYVK